MMHPTGSIFRIDVPGVFRRRGHVLLKDAAGDPFYLMGGAGTFTLPAGAYRVAEGAVEHLGPMKVRSFVPGKARFPLPARMSVDVGPNPNKASIHLRSGHVLIDPSVAALPDFVRTFVLAHEIGHYFHETEEGADGFAAHWMFCEGFNPSQIDAAARLSLRNCERTNLVNTQAHGYERK